MNTIMAFLPNIVNRDVENPSGSHLSDCLSKEKSSCEIYRNCSPVQVRQIDGVG